MDPQPLGITQTVILGLHLGEHDLLPLRTPQEQIRDPPAALLVLLRQHLTDRRERLAAEALDDLDEVAQFEGPVDADDARPSGELARVDVADDAFGLAVCDLHQAVVDLRRAGVVEGVGVQVERAGLERGLEDVGDVGEEAVVEEKPKLWSYYCYQVSSLSFDC